MGDVYGLDPFGHDPLVSAVVELRPDADEGGADTSGQDPSEVLSQAAAMLEGVVVETGPGQDPASEARVPEQGSGLAKAKGYFTKAGFEVHAPLGSTFSIAGRRSQFEELFGQRVVVDEDSFFSPVTTAEGTQELPLEPLPDEIRALVQAVSFPPPPELPAGLG